MSSETEREPVSRVGVLERDGPCQCCGRKVSQYEVAGEPQRSFFEHEHPWCEQFAAIAAEHGLGAERNPEELDDETKN